MPNSDLLQWTADMTLLPASSFFAKSNYQLQCCQCHSLHSGWLAWPPHSLWCQITQTCLALLTITWKKNGVKRNFFALPAVATLLSTMIWLLCAAFITSVATMQLQPHPWPMPSCPLGPKASFLPSSQLSSVRLLPGFRVSTWKSLFVHSMLLGSWVSLWPMLTLTPSNPWVIGTLTQCFGTFT